MAALTNDLDLHLIGYANKVGVPCSAADVFYAGAMVFSTALAEEGATTGCLPISAASRVFMGLVATPITTTAAGQFVEIWVNGVFVVPTNGVIVVADMGKNLVLTGAVQATSTDNIQDAVVNTAILVTENLIGQILNVDAAGNYSVQLKVNAGVTDLVGWGG